MTANDRKYNISVGTYYASQFVRVVQHCNGYMVRNIGTSTVTVQGMILYPGVPGTSIGDSVTIGGNRDEIYSGNIIVSFPVPAVAGQLVEITQKYYI